MGLKAWVPPLYEENDKGEKRLVTNRYVLSVTTPKTGRSVRAYASEWGLVGEIIDALHRAGKQGRKRLYVKVEITERNEPNGWKPIPDAESPEGCADARHDLERAVNSIQTMAETLDYFYQAE